MITLTKQPLTESKVINIITIILGMTVLTHFFALLITGFFSPSGFGLFLTDYAQYFNDWSLGKLLLPFLLKFKLIIAPLYGFAMLLAASCLILLIARNIVAISVGLSYLLAWHLLWNYPGMWTFEFFFPAFFSLCVGFANFNQPLLKLSLYRQFTLSKDASVVIILLAATFLYYITSIAHHSETAWLIAAASSVSFLILSFLHLAFDKKLNKCLANSQFIPTRFNNQIASLPWLDIMTIVIGAMLVMQVYSNYYSGLFTLKEYASLAEYYASASGAYWLRPFLSWSAKHANLLLPAQEIFETSAAILISLLIFRGPILLFSAGLFGLLAFAELGVSAKWPPVATNLTWEWELMLVTTISIIIGLYRTLELFQARDLKQAILGNKLFANIALAKRLFIALAGGLTLYFIGMSTQVFGDQYKIISLNAAISFSLLLMIQAFIDQYRSQVPISTNKP